VTCTPDCLCVECSLRVLGAAQAAAAATWQDAAVRQMARADAAESQVKRCHALMQGAMAVLGEAPEADSLYDEIVAELDGCPLGTCTAARDAEIARLKAEIAELRASRPDAVGVPVAMRAMVTRTDGASSCQEDPPKVQDIIRAYLIAHGYDGLAGEDCGCWLADLYPCGDAGWNCVPGHERRARRATPEDERGGGMIMAPGPRPDPLSARVALAKHLFETAPTDTGEDPDHGF
jgi:hypothetical protein